MGMCILKSNVIVVVVVGTQTPFFGTYKIPYSPCNNVY